jgi:hypothetical protein
MATRRKGKPYGIDSTCPHRLPQWIECDACGRDRLAVELRYGVVEDLVERVARKPLQRKAGEGGASRTLQRSWLRPSGVSGRPAHGSIDALGNRLVAFRALTRAFRRC